MERTQLEDLLCTSYGVDCESVMGSMSGLEGFERDKIHMLALIGNMLRGISSQGGSLRLTPSSGEPIGRSLYEPDLDEGHLMELVARQLKRATRSPQEPLNPLELLGGSKRVAFTPRIGR